MCLGLIECLASVTNLMVTVAVESPVGMDSKFGHRESHFLMYSTASGCQSGSPESQRGLCGRLPFAVSSVHEQEHRLLA